MSRRSALFGVADAVIALVLAGLMLLELSMYSPPVMQRVQSLTVSVQSATLGTTITDVNLIVGHGPSDRELDLAAFPLSRPVQNPAIFVFNDGTYPTANVIPRAIRGVFDHVSGELRLRGYQEPIQGVTGPDLPGLLAATKLAPNRALVLMMGILPSEVFSKTVDLITPWVKAGGLLIWGGGTIGFWSATSGHQLSAAAAVGEAGTERLLGKDVVQYPAVPGRNGTDASPFATALGISFQPTGAGVLRDSILARGGLSLGWYAGQFASVTFLPTGRGGYLIFGGDVLDEVPASIDLVRIILSGVLSGSGPVASRQLELSQLNPSQTVNWSLPFKTPTQGFMLVAFDPNPDGIYFFAKVLTA